MGSHVALSLSPRRLLGFLEEDKGADHDVLAAGSVVRRGGVDARSVERPARDRPVSDRVVALEHRDLGGLLLGKPVPLVVGAVGEAGGLADAVIVDAVAGDVGLVGERGPGAGWCCPSNALGKIMLLSARSRNCREGRLKRHYGAARRMSPVWIKLVQEKWSYPYGETKLPLQSLWPGLCADAGKFSDHRGTTPTH